MVLVINTTCTYQIWPVNIFTITYDKNRMLTKISRFTYIHVLGLRTEIQNLKHILVKKINDKLYH